MSNNSISDSKISCLCGAFTLPTTHLKVKNYPIDAESCHCNPCRQTTGSIIGATFVHLNEGPPSSMLENTLTAYASSSGSTRYFCSTCGGGTLMRDNEPNRWFMGTGTISRPEVSANDDPGPDTIKIRLHEWVDDTIDGGPVGKLRKLGGRKILVFAQDYQNNETPLSEHELDQLFGKAAASTTQRQKTLPVRCHCGTISFVLTAPDPTRDYNQTALNFLRSDRTKFRGLFCPCQSDHLACGLQMMSWIYPPVEHVLEAEGGKQLDWKNMAGLKNYQLDPPDGATRSFCGTCGATVFYQHPDGPQILNVAAGLLRAPSGTMARDWVDWDKELSHAHESRDSELAAALTA